MPLRPGVRCSPQLHERNTVRPEQGRPPHCDGLVGYTDVTVLEAFGGVSMSHTDLRVWQGGNLPDLQNLLHDNELSTRQRFADRGYDIDTDELPEGGRVGWL